MVEIVEEKQEQVANDEGGYDWRRIDGTTPGFNRLPLAKVLQVLYLKPI
jgi:hypothetical protein